MLKILLSLLMLLLLSCDKSNSISEPQPEKPADPFVLVTCWYYYSETGQRAFVNGSLFCDGQITYNSCKINDLTTTRSKMMSNGLQFGNYDYSNMESVCQDVENLQAEIITSAGKITGSVTGLPITPSTLIVSHLYGDTLAAGDTIKIDWENTNADFYNVRIMFFSKLDYFTIDTMVVGNQVDLAYDDYFLNQDGQIEQFNVIPVRGPLPRKDAPCNLSGNGKGYIYCSGQSKWLFRKIYLGYGTLDKADFAPKIKTQAEQAADLDKAIMKKLGVSK